MVETVRACTRCGSTTDVISTSLGVLDGPLQSVFPHVNLCVSCTDSFTRWMERRHRHRHGSPGRSHSRGSQEENPQAPELRISDVSRESESKAAHGPSSDDSDESPAHPARESSGRRHRRRRSSSSSSTGSNMSPSATILKLISHPAFLYVSLFIAAALMMFLLLKMIKTSPVDPEISG